MNAQEPTEPSTEVIAGFPPIFQTQLPGGGGEPAAYLAAPAYVGTAVSMSGLQKRKQLLRLALCPCGIGFLLLIILLPLSFHNIEYNEMAFSRNTVTGTISREKVYTTGRHFIGPAAAFVKFPASYQTIDFKKMSVWTKTERQSETTAGAAGTSTDLDVSLQYRLRPAELPALYQSVALQYVPFITNLATEAIKNISTNFTAEEWVKARQTIQDSLRQGVNRALNSAHADCDLLQLRQITFPQSYMDRMLASAVQLQTNQAEESLQQSQIIRSKTALAVRKIENAASVVNNTAEAQAKLVLIQAQQKVQTEKNEAEIFKQSAWLIRAQTAKEVADIENEARKVQGGADADAERIRALARNEATQRLDQARAEGLRIIGDGLGMGSQKEKVSLDYILRLVESSAETATFLGLPADLRTVATTA